MSKNAWKSDYYKGPKKKNRKDPLGNYMKPIKSSSKEVRDRRRLAKWASDMEKYGVPLDPSF